MSEIKYEDMPPKEVPPIEQTDELRKKAIDKIEANQVEEQVKIEAGIVKVPPAADQIPKELPQYLFRIGANSIACPRFNLDDDEAKLLAKHLSILTGNMNSKIFSFIIIIIVIIAKVTQCMDAIQRKFGKKQQAPAATPIKTTAEINDELADKEKFL